MKIFRTKKFLVAASLASASLLTTVQSVSKCAIGEISENGACQEDKVLKRSIAEARNDVDLPKVIMGLLSPATISNHFTDIVLFQSIIAIGWFTAIAVYQILINLPLSAEAKKEVEQLGFWFKPNAALASEGINIRNQIFGFFLGRVLYDFITDPEGTREEIAGITWTELRNRMLSNDYLLTWTGRFVFQFLLVMTGIAVLYGFSNSQEKLFVQDRKLDRNLDDIHDSVQASLLKDFI